MSITRRNLMRFVPFLAVALPAPGTTRSSDGEDGHTFLGIRMYDDVSVSVLKIYAGSVALEDEEARCCRLARIEQARVDLQSLVSQARPNRHA
jgi:hypothetical protein